jgi:hypothetical protein
MLRTEISFRRAIPKGPWQHFVAAVSAHWPFFRHLRPRSQRLFVAAVAAVASVAVIMTILVTASGRGVDAEPAASPDQGVNLEAEQPSVPPEPSVSSDSIPAPVETQPTAEGYAYQGPQYEIVAVDDGLTSAELSQYWVYSPAFDYSTAGYRDQIKLIVADIAHQNGTADLIVNVVTDKEVAFAEAFSTYENFVAEYGEDYAINHIPLKEKEHWVASYSGGYDYDNGQPSESTTAYEIVWWPYADTEIEIWRP